MTVEARIRVHHQGCLSEWTHGTTTITQLGAEGKCSIFLLTGETPEELDALLKESEKRLSGYTELCRSPNVAMIRGGCPPEGIEECILSYGCSILFPSLFSEGREVHRIVAPSRERLQQLVERLEDFGPSDVTLEAVSDVGPESLQVSVNLADITRLLTKKQLAVLTTAVEAGYYRSPRRTSTERLAKSFGISRSTLQEHLRKAESKVLASVMNLLGDHPVVQKVARSGGGRFAKEVVAPIGP